MVAIVKRRRQNHLKIRRNCYEENIGRYLQIKIGKRMQGGPCNGHRNCECSALEQRRVAITLHPVGAAQSQGDKGSQASGSGQPLVGDLAAASGSGGRCGGSGQLK